MTDKKLTDNEIIKALECCSCETIMYCEDQCPFYKKCMKDEPLSKYALDLINRQKSEIERLKSANDEKFHQWHILAEKSKQYYADLYNEAKYILKSEAVKEFAERLKEETLTTDKFGEILLVQDIDNLVKEMVDDDNA